MNDTMSGEIPGLPPEETGASETFENQQEAERRPEITELIQWGEKALAGELQGDPNSDEFQDVTVSPESRGTDFDLGDGPFVDLNDDRYTADEQRELLAWLEQKLGASVDEAPVGARYAFADGSLEFSVYGKDFGKPGNVWRVTRWNNIQVDDDQPFDAPNPWYVLRSQAMIDEDVDPENEIYTQIEDESETPPIQ